MKLKNKISNWLNLNKPGALTWDEWNEWHEKTKAAKPIPYFIMETIPDFWNRFIKHITEPYNNVRYYIKARFFDRYHLINTRLPYGYHDTGERMIHGMFSLLVDYVELEISRMDTNTEIKRPFWSKGIFRIKSFRCAQSGIEHLLWEATLDSTYAQSRTAQEVLDLYFWWTKVRPQRLDPWVLSGSDEYYKNTKFVSILSDKKSPKDKKIEQEYAARNSEIEQEYLEEDNRQLERLLKIRMFLWT